MRGKSSSLVPHAVLPFLQQMVVALAMQSVEQKQLHNLFFYIQRRKFSFSRNCSRKNWDRPPGKTPMYRRSPSGTFLGFTRRGF